MINLLKKSCRISLALLCCATGASAQGAPGFTWEAKLPKVDSFMFYRIPITPALSAKAFRDGEWDIRIFGDSAEVPYLLERSHHVTSDLDFIAYATPTLESVPGKETVIVFEPKPQQSINSFGLRYTNTAVTKTAVLTGSNDGVQWFAIRPAFPLEPSAAVPVPGKETIVEQTITLPLSGYRFFRLVIDDSATAPLHINCVGFSRRQQQEKETMKVATVKLELQQGKDRRTDRFLMALPEKYLVQVLTVPVLQPGMYRREADLLAIEDGRERLLMSFVLYSEESSNGVQLHPNTMADSLVLIVRNGDNRPLMPGEAEVWQDAYVMIAQLKPGNYILRGGAPGLHAPEYDTEFFSAAYRAKAARELVPDAPAAIAQPEVKPAGTGVFGSRWWIWAGIVVVVGVLAVVVRGLLRDMNKEKR